MNYSDNEIKIRALKFFQSRIVSYLQIIINKEYYRQENKKKYLTRLLGNINTIACQIHGDLIEMQDDDSLFPSIITSIDSLLKSVNKSSELSKKDVTEQVKVIVSEEFIEEGEYKYSQREIFIPKTYNMEKSSGRELRELIQQNEIYRDCQIKISEIWEELLEMSNSIDSDVIMTIEDAVIGKNINNEVEIPPIWILPTSTFPIECTLEILTDGLEEGLTKDEIFLNKLMISCRIEETLNSWKEKKNSNVRKRIHILNEAITAHLERKYYLSVSTLIPQIEGLLEDAVKEAEIKDVNLDSLKEGCIKNAADKLVIKWQEQNKNMQNFARLLNKNFPEVIAYLYQEYDSQRDKENHLNRHGICHGSQTNFGTATSSLRLILIIDRIIFFMADEE